MKFFHSTTLVFLLIINSSFANDTNKQMKNLYNKYTSGKVPSFAREKRLEDQNAESILDGEVVYLNTQNKKIFAIFTEAESKTDVGVILLHTRGEHPDESRLINPLRIDFAENDYHSLSVQMPVLEKSAKYYDYVPIFVYSHKRIMAAMDFYKSKGVKNIVIVAHACGAHMLMSYLDLYGDDGIAAIIGIGMGATDTGQEVVTQFPLANITTPVLDIFGQFDYPSVKKHAKIRAAILNNNSKQVVLKKAGHYHVSDNQLHNLTTTIYAWLDEIL